MSNTHSTQSSDWIVKLIRFLEKTFKNSIIQIKWLWRKSVETHRHATKWHRSNFKFHPIWNYTYALIIFIIALWCILPLVVWAALKSI